MSKKKNRWIAPPVKYIKDPDFSMTLGVGDTIGAPRSLLPGLTSVRTIINGVERWVACRVLWDKSIKNFVTRFEGWTDND